jgi:hypothetical protein
MFTCRIRLLDNTDYDLDVDVSIEYSVLILRMSYYLFDYCQCYY